MDAVDIIAACHLFTHSGDIVARLGILGVHIAFFAYFLDELRQLLAYLLTAVAVPFSHGNGHHPGVTLHAALMAFVDTELQRVISGRLSASTRHTDVPGLDGRRVDGRCPDARLQQYGVDISLLQLVEGLDGRRVDGRCPDARLQQYGVDISLLQLVEDVDEFLSLLVGRARTWPVEVLDGGEPYGSYFVFGRLCMEVQCHP